MVTLAPLTGWPLALVTVTTTVPLPRNVTLATTSAPLAPMVAAVLPRDAVDVSQANTV